MPTPEKSQTIAELSDQLAKAALVIVTDYRGLKVADLQTLRGNLRPTGAEFRVAKNTHAAKTHAVRATLIFIRLLKCGWELPTTVAELETTGRKRKRRTRVRPPCRCETC